MKEASGCKTSRGCALGNACVEIPEDNKRLGDIVHTYKAEIRRRLRKLSREMGAKEPDVLGDALMLLVEGSYYTRPDVSGKHGAGDCDHEGRARADGRTHRVNRAKFRLPSFRASGNPF